MLINEDRLRELYAAGEIDLEHLERSLDIINRRREAGERRPVRSERASAPLTYDEKRAMLDAAPPAPPRTREPLRFCPNCRSAVRDFQEQTMTAWCNACGGTVSLNPYTRRRGATAGRGGFIVAGGYVECGPDADGDGDVDGGLFDLFG